MKTEHYPSLELCKKLTEIGFPTTFQHIGDSGWTVIWCGEIPEWMYVSPSVMEMLDVMPDTIAQEYLLNFWKNNDSQYWVQYEEVNGHSIWECWKWFSNLPNALAEMILWLHENKYITF